MRTVKIKSSERISVKDFVISISKALCPVDIGMVGMDCVRGWEIAFYSNDPLLHTCVDPRSIFKMPGVISSDDRLVLEEILADLPLLHMRMTQEEQDEFHQKYYNHAKSLRRKLLLYTEADANMPEVARRLQSIADEHFLALNQMVGSGEISIYAKSGLRADFLSLNSLLTKEQVRQYARRAGLIVEFQQSKDKEGEADLLTEPASEVVPPDPKVEVQWYERWDRKSHFRDFIIDAQRKSTDPRDAKEVFDIMISDYLANKELPKYMAWIVSSDGREIRTKGSDAQKKKFNIMNVSKLKKVIEPLYKRAILNSKDKPLS